MLTYVFLFAPIVVLIIFSFNVSRRNFVWLGFTLDWYPKLFANHELLDALSVTLQVAVIAIIGSTILGSLLGLGLARLQFRGSGATETLILLPMITPEIIMGISLLIFFGQLFRQNGSLGQIGIAHITFCISYVAIVVRARALSLDPRLEEAARDLGASAWGAFRHVTLPLIAPAVAAGAMLTFALSFDDLIVTSFNAGSGSTHAADLHLQLDQVRGHAPDQRDLDDHRRPSSRSRCSSPGGWARSGPTSTGSWPRTPDRGLRAA